MAEGYVVHAERGCDYYLVSTSLGFALLQWFGGNIPEKGDFLVGDFEMYGLKDVENRTCGQVTKAWVDDFWLDESSAIKKYQNKCR